MISLKIKESQSYHERNICYIYKKEFSIDNKDKKHQKVRDHCHYTGKYRGAAHDICNLRNRAPKEILVVFHNGSTYDYHFIIKELAEAFNGQYKCLGENTEKYLIFSEPINKEFDNSERTTYKIKFIDSFGFMSSSLSSLVVLLIILLKDFTIINAQIASLVLSTYQWKMNY